MKRIGILTRINDYNKYGKRLFIPENIYLKVKNRVEVILIPHSSEDDFDMVLNLVKTCDGIIIPGGKDIFPLETKLVKYLYENDIPTLGICLGMQTMGEAINGKVEAMRNSSHHIPDQIYAHEIKIDENSKLYDILKQENILVNSRHYDNVIKTDLFKSAYSSDQIIEALEDPNKKFFIGLQWHPEDIDDDNSNKIFASFIDSL